MAIAKDNPRHELKVIICGAGLCGLATGIALRLAGYEVVLIERSPVLYEIGAGINVPPNATRLFRRWNIFEKVSKVAIQPAAANMRQGETGEILASQNMSQELEDKYHSPYWVVHRADLHKVLLTEALELGCTLHLGCDIVSIDPSVPSLKLATGEEHTAHVILCADGERSFGRSIVAPDSAKVIDSGDHVFRITAKIDDVKKIGLEELVEPPSINSWNGHNGFALTYNLKRDNLLNVVLTASHPPGSAIIPGPQPISVEDVRKVFEGWDERFQRLLTVSQTCSQWTLFTTPEPETWIHPSGKFGLIGDAAHSMVPFIGQGGALAFEDAGALDILMSGIEDASQIPDALFIFQRLRRPRCREMRSKSQDLRHVLVCEDDLLRAERDRQLRQFKDEPFEGFPNFLADPVLQKWIMGYDATAEAMAALKRYQSGRWPSTRGSYRLTLPNGTAT